MSDKGKDVHAACDGKVPFVNAVLAMRAIRRTKFSKLQQRRNKSKRSVYRCPFCGHWHLGNNHHDRAVL